MSGHDFFGRPLSRGMDDLEFELCEICQRKSPTWLEVQYENDQPVVRFACNDCHEDYKSRKNEISEDLARQIDDEEELPNTTRPGWVDDFIKEGDESGTIENVDTVEQMEEGDEEPDITFSEAPESFKEADSEPELEEERQRQISNWAPEFIQEALFGPNPEGWLEEKGAYQEKDVDLTLKTLQSFSEHNVNSVKLSAIQCLLGIYNRHPSYEKKVLESLKKYELDQDDTVSEFAKQSISQIS